MSQESAERFHAADRPRIALITNHGYGGVAIPFGGAPDTGGQNVYVNALGRALDALGYKVTIFARGGFPFYESDRLRDEPEYLTDMVRYVYVPGGGDAFIRKEDIAVALDEEVAWLDAHVRKEAEEAGCRPFELYEIVNTHYWDAANMGMLLVERWCNDLAAEMLIELLDGCLPAETLHKVQKDRHWSALGEAPAFHLGNLLLEAAGSPATPVTTRLGRAIESWVERHGPGEDEAAHIERAVNEEVEDLRGKMAPVLHQVVVAEALGSALLDLLPDRKARLDRDLYSARRHVWTPHSLGALKEENFKDKPPEVVRDLKFNERRDHERTVCDRTRAFAATSPEIAERLRTHYAVPAQRIFYFPPCVDRSVFRDYSEEERRSTYAYLAEVSGVAEDRLRAGRIVFETSRMDQTKRKDVLLEAFAQVASEVEDAYLFIGGGPEKELFGELSETRRSLPALEGRAFLTGFIPEEYIGTLFDVADLYVSASEMEGFGMSVLQGAANGTAVVCSDLIPFALQYVPDHAIIVPAGDVDGFAEAMSRLLRDDDERGRRAEALQEATRAFEWESQAEAFLDYLRRRGFQIQAGRRDS